MAARPPIVSRLTAANLSREDRNEVLAKEFQRHTGDVNAFARELLARLEELEGAEPSTTSAVNTPELIYKTAAGQSIPNATVTRVDFDTVVVDTDSVVTTGAGWKATLPAGTYDVDALVAVVVPAGTAYDAFVDVYVNDGSGAVLEFRGPRCPGTVPGAGSVVGLTANGPLRLTSTSDVYVSVYQNTGSARNLETGGGQTNRITIRRVR